MPDGEFLNVFIYKLFNLAMRYALCDKGGGLDNEYLYHYFGLGDHCDRLWDLLA